MYVLMHVTARFEFSWFADPHLFKIVSLILLVVGVCGQIQGCEYLLFPSHQLTTAAMALLSAGHAIRPSIRLCPPLKEDFRGTEKSWKFAGLWVLSTPKTSEAEPCFRLQGSCGVYIDIRPATDVLDETSCAGYLKVSGLRCQMGRMVGLQPAMPEKDSHITWSEDGHEYHQDFSGFGGPRETWRRLSGRSAVVLKLMDEPKRKSPARQGFWIIAGGRFARVIGLSGGQGVIDGSCCASLKHLKELLGSIILEELEEHYEVTSVLKEGSSTTFINYFFWVCVL